MSTKLAGKSGAGKKETQKKGSKAEPKAEKKSAAKAAPAPEPAQNEPTAAELEELEEQEEAANASSSGGNAAALAAASGSTEMSASFKNFRHHPDMENFYRFIYDNDLRHEALAIIDQMILEKNQKKPGKPTKGAH